MAHITTVLSAQQLESLEALAISLIPPPAEPVKEVPKADRPENEKKAEKAMRLAKAHWQPGHHKGISHILGALLDVDQEVVAKYGEDPRVKSYNDAGKKGQAIVMLTNPNGHTYTTNRPAFLLGRGDGICRQFSEAGKFVMGNHAPTTESNVLAKDSWRFATAEEIKAEIARVAAIVAKPGSANVAEDEWYC